MAVRERKRGRARERGKEGGREGGREGERESGREGEWERGREGGQERERGGKGRRERERAREAGRGRGRELGSGDHGSKGWNDFSILASFEATVGVHPEDVVVEDGKHFLRPLCDLFCGGDFGRVDVVDSRANAGSIFDSLTAHREELLVGA